MAKPDNAETIVPAPDIFAGLSYYQELLLLLSMLALTMPKGKAVQKGRFDVSTLFRIHD